MRSTYTASSITAFAALFSFGCTPFLGPIPDGGADASVEAPAAPSSDALADSERRDDDAPMAGPGDAQQDRSDVAVNDSTSDVEPATDATQVEGGRPEPDAISDTKGPSLPEGDLLVHLEADYGLVNDSTHVSKWKDQSGNGFDASESDPTYQPLYLDDINAGFGAPLFGVGGLEDLFLPDGFTNLQNGLSLFFVVSLQKTSGAALLFQTDPNGPILNLSSNPSSGVVDVNYVVGHGANVPGHAYDFPYSSWHLVELVQQGGNGGSANFSSYLDGAALVSASQLLPTTEVKTASIGRVIPDAVLALQAVIVYARPLSNSERSDVEEYLMTKWQVSQSK